MKKLPLEIKDIADKINSKQGNQRELMSQLNTLVSNYNFLYNNDFRSDSSKCVIEKFAGLLEPTFYATNDYLIWFIIAAWAY